MKKVILIIALILNIVSAKEYPTINLKLGSVSGYDVRQKDKVSFFDGLRKELLLRGNIKLRTRAFFILKVRVNGALPKLDSRVPFYKNRAFKIKQKIHLKAKYRVIDWLGDELFSGVLPFNLNLNIKGWFYSRKRANEYYREKVFSELGERIGSKLNDRFHFMVDFLRQSKHRHRQHTKFIYLKEGDKLDLETGRVGTRGSRTDLSWKAFYGKEDMHFFEPLNRASFAIVKNKNYNRINKRFVINKKLSKIAITAFNFDKNLKKGAVLVFKTSEGNYGKMKILGFRQKGNVKHYAIHLKWVLFK